MFYAFPAVPWASLQSAFVILPDHSHLLFKNLRRKYTELIRPFKKTISLKDIAGLQIRVRIEKLFSLFLIQNICCGYSKEPSQ